MYKFKDNFKIGHYKLRQVKTPNLIRDMLRDVN